MEKNLKMLALETTDVSGSVALWRDGQVVERRVLCAQQRSAQSLAPAIQSLLKDHDWRPTDVDVVAVTVGPGSFTGLRVGVATGKMFAWAVNAKIVGVDALDAIVASLLRCGTFKPERPTVLSVGIDAQRGDAAVRNYLIVSEPDVMPISLDERFHVVSVKKWLGTDGDVAFQDALAEETLEEFKRVQSRLSAEQTTALRSISVKDVVFAGPALRRVRNLTEAYPTIKLAPEESWNPDASGVALAAWNRVEKDDFDDVWSILPIYSRRAAAEEKALAKQKALEEAQNAFER